MIKSQKHILKRALVVCIASTTLLSALPVMAAGLNPAMLKRASAKGGFKVARINTQDIATSTTSASGKVEKNWSIPINVESSSTLHTQDSYERSAQNSLEISPGYSITKRLRASAAIALFQETTGAGNTGFDNTALNLSYKTELRPNINWTNGVRAVLPTNRELQDTTTYQGAARVSSSIKFTELFLGSSFMYAANYTRNFHELTLSSAGAANVKQTIGQTLEFSLPFAGDFSFNTNFIYSYGLTYADDMRTKFIVGADISWDFAKDWSAYVGTSNEGNALKPNGTDSNIQFYDDNSSVIKIGIGYTL